MTFDNLIHPSMGLSAEEIENFRTQIRELLIKGKAEGKITQEEIEEAIPYSAIDYEALGEIFKVFEDQGVTVVTRDKMLIESLQNKLMAEGFSWMRRSALTERAYWQGAYQALSMIDGSDALLRSIFFKASKTLFNRAGDDSFPGTTLGALFLELDEFIQRRSRALQSLEQLIERIHREIDLLNKEFSVCQVQVRELIGDLHELTQCNDLVLDADTRSRSNFERDSFEVLQAIRKRFQYLALLQTSHDIQSRFD